MAEPYAQTAVPFDRLPLAALRDPVLAGPGIGGMGDAAERYRHLADTLQRATDDLRAAMRGAQGAHDGEAAEASRQYVERLAAVGELGAGQARIAVGALDDGASYYSRVADDMRALQTDLPTPRNVAHAEAQARAVDELRVLAVEAAQRYESNANWSAGRTFQAFDAPALAAPGEGGGVPVTGASVGGIGSAALGSGGSGTGGAGASVVGAGTGPGAPTAGTDAGAAGLVGGRPAAGSGVGAGSGVAGAGSVAGAGGPGIGSSGLGSPGAGSAGAGSPGVGGPGAGAPGNAATGPGGVGAVPVDGGARGSGVSSPAAGAAPYSRPPAVPIGRSGPGEPGTTGTGWVPGTPWSGRPQPDAGTAARAVPAEPPASPRPGGGTAAGPTAAAIGRTGATGMPMMPMAGVGRGQDSGHTRPAWLVEDDPQTFWFSGIPEHTAGVIGGEGDTDH